MERHTCQGYEASLSNYLYGEKPNGRQTERELPYLFNNRGNHGLETKNILSLAQNKGCENYTSRNLVDSRSKSSNLNLEENPLFRVSRNLNGHARKRSYNLRSRSRKNKAMKRRKTSLQDLYFMANIDKNLRRPPQPEKNDPKRSFHINLKIELKENQEPENSNETAYFGNRGKERQFKIKNLSKNLGSPKRVNKRYICSSSPKRSPTQYNIQPHQNENNSSIKNSPAIKVVENTIKLKRSKSGKMKVETVEETQNLQENSNFGNGIRELNFSILLKTQRKC